MELAWWRRVLLAIVLVGSAGTLTELLLLEHTEEFYQLIPVVLLALALVASGLALALPRPWVIVTLRIVMAACFISAAIGIFLHYRGNTEFALERHSSLRGWKLFSEAMMGATPSLAPGAMAQLALIGLLSTFRIERNKIGRDSTITHA